MEAGDKDPALRSAGAVKSRMLGDESRKTEVERHQAGQRAQVREYERGARAPKRLVRTSSQ